jgi:hypothetical protein
MNVAGEPLMPLISSGAYDLCWISIILWISFSTNDKACAIAAQLRHSGRHGFLYFQQ